MWTDGWTCMAKPAVAFRSFANAPKIMEAGNKCSVVQRRRLKNAVVTDRWQGSTHFGARPYNYYVIDSPWP